MTQEMIWGVIRALLAGGSGYLAAKGLGDAETYNAIIGAIGVIFTSGWSIWAKKRKIA